jgi:hypothetical protein
MPLKIEKVAKLVFFKENSEVHYYVLRKKIFCIKLYGCLLIKVNNRNPISNLTS